MITQQCLQHIALKRNAHHPGMVDFKTTWSLLKLQKKINASFKVPVSFKTYPKIAESKASFTSTFCIFWGKNCMCVFWDLLPKKGPTLPEKTHTYSMLFWKNLPLAIKKNPKLEAPQREKQCCSAFYCSLSAFYCSLLTSSCYLAAAVFAEKKLWLVINCCGQTCCFYPLVLATADVHDRT